eukprot:403368480
MSRGVVIAIAVVGVAILALIGIFASSSENKASSTSEESVEVCPITQQPIKKRIQTKCGHVFEKSALAEWKKSKTSCPVCRKKL